MSDHLTMTVMTFALERQLHQAAALVAAGTPVTLALSGKHRKLHVHSLLFNISSLSTQEYIKNSLLCPECPFFDKVCRLSLFFLFFYLGYFHISASPWCFADCSGSSRRYGWLPGFREVIYVRWMWAWSICTRASDLLQTSWGRPWSL